MRFAPAPTAVRCPFCQAPITVPIHRVIDAVDQPEIKAQLLSGRLNAFTCPNCRNTGALTAPFIYHDGDKELALIFLPIESGLNNTDQQRIIGQLTQSILNAVPPEKRKAYLLQPQQFFTLQSLIETILRADGITPEMIQAQQARIDLLQRLVEARDDAAFEAIVNENDAQIDLAFLQLVSAAMGGAQVDNRADEFARLAAVRSRLIDLTSAGQKVKAQTESVNAFLANPSRESLLEQMLKAPDSGARLALLSVGRGLLDYPFFQQLTAKIDAAKSGGDTAEAERLTELRKEILALRDQIDAQAQLAVEQRATVLRELLLSDDLEQAARERIDLLDDLFFNVLSSQMQAAQGSDAKSYERLRQVGDVALRVIRELQPPEIQFLSALLAARYPDQTRTLLERNRQALAPEFIDWLDSVAGDLRQDGRGESADHLTQVIAQARELAAAPAAG
jgi:hypothetical protein